MHGGNPAVTKGPYRGPRRGGRLRDPPPSQGLSLIHIYEARGLIGLARAELEYVPPRVLVSDLHARLERLERTISLVSDLATRRYFAHDLPVEWQLETDA